MATPGILSLGFLLLLFSCFANCVRRYNFTVTSQWSVADGHGRPAFAINGKTPGPLVTAEEGEEIEVFVDNQLATETTMHWHGVYQVDRPWNDGVPGVTQYSIQPRDNYTYRFTVQQQYGSYFYHGHFGPAFADGQRGPIWISPAPWRPRPYKSMSSSPNDIKGMQRAEENPRHIVISDWNAEPMDILLVMYRDTSIVPWCSNSIVLNGKGRTYCHSKQEIEDSGGPGRNDLGCIVQDRQDLYANPQSCEATDGELEVIMAEEGEEWVWINFIHSGAHHELQISIDKHEFYVVAADGEFVHPQKVHAANCNLGERISILVHLNQKPGDYAIRLTSLRVEQIIQGLGILRYGSKVKESSSFVVPNTEPWVHLNGTLVSPSLTAMDEDRLAPFPQRPPPRTADSTLKLFVNMTGPAAWSLGLGSHQAFRQQLPPLLWEDESRGDTTFGGQGSLLNGSVVDIIFENGANVTTQHPFHKHNHKAWIIGTGHGGFPWATVEEAIQGGAGKFFNLVDPPIRDGCRLGNATGDWTVIRYQITFPAASMLHCHMIHHFGAGQQLVLLEGVESMAKIPQEVKNKVHADFVPDLRYGPLD
ncbi:laccase-1 [Fusarium mexicanum]|uniref:Laccase-1 n=1 Tax=Fusarium mexicanum TaxID=751941 RepID=A0A8H5JHK2_9HYPO|nr:laccase-1 [Fusarium mexicanum]